MNITEDYVSFETAKLLKEKGFDEKCQKVYMHNGQLLWAQIFMEGESFVDNKCIEAVANYNDWITYTQGEYAYLCPTLQMAMKWLLQKHRLYVNVAPSVEGYYWTEKWHSYAEELNKRHPFGRFINTFESYEEAAEAAIKYCLENLI